jgi:hypothetical protein
VPLPETILPELRTQLESLKDLHRRDLDRGYAGVLLINALENKPIKPPPSTSHAEFRRKRIRIKTLTTNIINVKISVTAPLPSCHVTIAINAKDAIFTQSSTAPAITDLRSLGTIGPLTPTKKTPVGRFLSSQ